MEVPPKAPVRVFIVDQHPIVRIGMRCLLDTLPVSKDGAREAASRDCLLVRFVATYRKAMVGKRRKLFWLSSMSLLLFGGFGTLIAPSGCSLTEEKRTPEVLLPGSAWQLERIEFENGEDWIPADEDISAVQFNEDGSVLLRADCNVCDTGSYGIRSDSITVNVGSCTEAGCGVTQSIAYPELVAHAYRVEVSRNRLLLVARPFATFPQTTLHHRRVSVFPDPSNR